jgi:hypothetical protein
LISLLQESVDLNERVTSLLLIETRVGRAAMGTINNSRWIAHMYTRVSPPPPRAHVHAHTPTSGHSHLITIRFRDPLLNVTNAIHNVEITRMASQQIKNLFYHLSQLQSSVNSIFIHNQSVLLLQATHF